MRRGIWGRIVLIVTLVLALAGCGQKGALYMPGQKAAAANPTAVS